MQKIFHVVVLLFLLYSGNSFAQNNALIAPPVKADTINPGNCYNAVVNLVVPGGADNLNAVPGSKIIWEYLLTPPTGATDVYTVFGISTAAQYSFTPVLSFGNTQINTTQNRYLRVRHVSANTNTTYATSLTVPITFSPSAPTFKTAEVLPTTASCSNSPTGSINISHTKYTDTILYIVKNSNDGTYCNPITNNPPCFNVVKSGKTTDTNFVITGITAGTYNVFISNIGGNFGTCNQVAIAVVSTLPPIQINGESAEHPQCYNDNNGKIHLQVSGGDSLTYRYFITPNVGTKQYQNGQIDFNNLPQGNYLVTFSDTCGTLLSRNFTLVHPPKVEGSVLKTVPNCASPGNGVIKILAHYNFNAPGFNTFHYKLFKNGICTDSLMNTTDTVFTVSGLQGATYRAIAYAPSKPDCIGIDETFVLPFTPLTLSTDSVKQINCNGQTDGYIKVKASGGTNSYIYYLRNLTTGLVTIDSFGVFQNLAPASYTAIGKNRNGPCLDSATVNILITQPSNIAVTVAKQDIQCFNFADGKLIAAATGGNGGYIYYWEKQNPITGNWASYFQTGDTINNVSAGIYRSKITDSKNCSGFSLPVTILEPDSLKIDSVRVKDIPCFAGTGFIQIFSRGGNPGHIQQYRKLPDASYINFTPTTGLAAGLYLVRVTDSKGCTTFFNDTLVITSPPSNLDFTYTQAQINGFNISCYGAANGSMVINATG